MIALDLEAIQGPNELINTDENLSLINKNNTEIDNTLLELLKNEINTEEGKLFISNYIIYLKYGNDDSQYVIDLDDIWKEIGFNNKGNSKKLLIKNFEIDTDYVVSNMLVPTEKHLHGGHNKEIIKMNVNTFKAFCMIANTEKGKATRKYYLKMENIFFKYCENLNKNIIEKMQIENNNKIIAIEQDNILFNIKKKHEILLNAHKNKSLVYMLKVDCPFIDKNLKLIKIGSSDDIGDRISKIKNTFGCNVYIINAYPCENNRGFEKFLLHHHKINPHKYNELIGNNKVKSIECFLLKDDNMIESFKRIIDNNILCFRSKNLEEKKLDLELKREENIKKWINLYNEKPDQVSNIINKLYDNNINIINLIKNDNNTLNNDYNIILDNLNHNIEPVLNKNNNTDIISTNQNINNKPQGPKVQIYDINDLTKLIKVFDTITLATREIQNSSYTAIKFAAKNKINYLNYRWHLIHRNEINPLSAKNIGDTVDINIRRTGFIAMLNLNKDIIENVFINQKTASAFISAECSAMSTAIKYNKPLSSNYWSYWDDLCEPLKKSYLEINTLPIKSKNIRGQNIQQIDPNSSILIKIHNSITDVCKEFHMSAKTIKKVIIREKVYNGFLWKMND